MAKRVERITYNPNDPAIAWAGGYVEAEGCFYINGSYPRIQIESTDADILERFKSIVGVGTTRALSRRPGAPAHHKPVFRFQCGGERALDLMAALYPYLGIRRQQRVQGILDAFRTPAKLAA